MWWSCADRSVWSCERVGMNTVAHYGQARGFVCPGLRALSPACVSIRKSFPFRPRASSLPAIHYTLSITPALAPPRTYTPDYCQYRFLNRKIYTLNMAVNTEQSVACASVSLAWSAHTHTCRGWSAHTRLLPLTPSATVYYLDLIDHKHTHTHP